MPQDPIQPSRAVYAPRKDGTPRKRRTFYALPLLERYEVAVNGCWNYTGHVNAEGYGMTNDGPAHRVFYKSLVGEIPKGFQIDHLCRNKSCVNPAHLEAVTHYENLRRSGFGGHLPIPPQAAANFP